MSTTSGAYRWWENYLVRYLMPSIAGAAIVNWLSESAEPSFKKLLLIDVGASGLQTPTLVLLFLYGNLFCYVASYPILGFHVTRVIDGELRELPKRLADGYTSSLLLATAVFIASLYRDKLPRVGIAVPFILVIMFVIGQLYRLRASCEKVAFHGLEEKASKIFAYTYSISKRRGEVEQLHITKQLVKDRADDQSRDTFDEENEWHERSNWHREFIDTYRHMREHGNSAFIFLLELTLAGLCFLVITASKSEGATYQLSLVGLLFAVWAIPAMFVHLLGQQIERRFSWYDRKLQAADRDATPARSSVGGNSPNGTEKWPTTST